MVALTRKDLRIRHNFGTHEHALAVPNLIEIQKKSYARFLQKDVDPDQREEVGLQRIFKGIFPISDFNETASLEFVSYQLNRPQYTVEECRERGMNYAALMRVEFRLEIYEVDPETNEKSIRDIKQNDVYFGEIPLMTNNGTFIVNGTERVVVSQLHRSPGAFFGHDKGRTHSSGKLLYSARVIPYRGSWLDFEFDHKDLLYVRIDRRRKMPATVLLKALGYTTEELLDFFYAKETILLDEDGNWRRKLDARFLVGQRVQTDITDDEGNVIIKAGKKFSKNSVNRLSKMGIESIPVTKEQLLDKFHATDIIDLDTGEVVAECNEEVTEEALDDLRERQIPFFEVLYIDAQKAGPYIRDTLKVDKVESSDEAVLEIYRRLRPGEPSNPVHARTYLNNLFFSAARYDLSTVGRVKLNYKFKLDEPITQTVLTHRDILEVVRYLVDLKNGKGHVDDIDHLGNRRIRAVGELLENQYRIGLIRMERAIREKMSLSQEIEMQMPGDIVNAKPVTAVVREYFGSSQLSQFMDQTNPLSEITHKRRLSALGQGGLTRERAGFEVRDVHPTHYGRICPIETPEGPNIGLISSLATYARVNDLGFIETPYRVVTDAHMTNEVRWLSALEEEDETIAQANAEVNTSYKFKRKTVAARAGGEVVMAPAGDVTLMDVSPNQLVSVSAALIPFLEHDDANRALMGSNMQRQAVPLLRPAAPLVGTMLERAVARDSGASMVALHDGTVESVDAQRIVVRRDPSREGEIVALPDIYSLVTYRRSNQNTALNQRPIVQPDDRVVTGDVIADGASTNCGELALGANVLVAFMPWGGYNFEDSILLSERMVKDDTFTSVHIEEFECDARDTKLGKEEITRDIPNVSEEMLAHLDASGIIRIGAEVQPGDILVGKVTPKGETQLSPEEKLLRAIFGEKASDVKDTSKRVPPGVVGTVIDAKVFARKGVEKDERTLDLEEAERQRLLQDKDDEVRIITQSAHQAIKRMLSGRTVRTPLVSDAGKVLIEEGANLEETTLDKIPRKYWTAVDTEDGDLVRENIRNVLMRLDEKVRLIDTLFEERVDRLQKGDDLPPGVIKKVKVYVAIKRKIQVGDKMAGRHGNKGVVSRILPAEDMPFLPDGTPVDIVLNPLGVPSRMNVGQVLETHLGWAAFELGKQVAEAWEAAYGSKAIKKKLKEIFPSKTVQKTIDQLDDDQLETLIEDIGRGIHFATPVFDGATEEQIDEYLKLADLPYSGQITLRDGRNGDEFGEKVTVGIMYMLKLHHLVDDKIHARSIGPYSLVTQQPLGGKAQFGGQRLGEMEVWAMEAYGAAYSLQEFLTVKSDDVAGRTRMYEAIVKGDHTLQAGLPESFKVVIQELKALALDVTLEETG
jgi:DNA-directed RNA polymerase subunit beta